MAILTDRRQPAISTYDPVARVPAVPPDDATPIEPSRGGSGSVQFDFSVTGAVTRLATAGRAPPRRQPKNALHLSVIIIAVGAALSTAHSRVMTAIEQCRTAALGGHVEQCDHCGHRRVWYNSCRNRHCPTCQSLARATWLERRREDLLPTEWGSNRTETFPRLPCIPSRYSLRLELMAPTIIISLAVGSALLPLTACDAPMPQAPSHLLGSAQRKAMTAAEAKLDSRLLAAVDRLRTGSDAFEIREALERDTHQRVLVDITGEVTPGLLDAIGAGGGTVLSKFPRYNAVRAWAPIEALLPLAELDDVRGIRPADRAVTRSGQSQVSRVHTKGFKCHCVYRETVRHRSGGAQSCQSA